MYKQFSEIYRQYNENGKFIVILFAKVPRDSTDFNLSPDKRDVNMKDEEALIIALKKEINEVIEGNKRTIKTI